MPVNNLLLDASKGLVTLRPPVWIMRQAGRILPEYRQLRAQFRDFKHFIKTPEATAEATLQPLNALGVDAAIIFSDILVIPEVLGFNYEMVESRGPVFSRKLSVYSDLPEISTLNSRLSDLNYVFEALDLAKSEIQDQVPLIGFAGAPWTIFAYMVEGKGSKDFSAAKKMLYTDPASSHKILQTITEMTILYLKEKIRRGCDIIQIFDSWAGILSPTQFKEFALKYTQQIVDALTEVPVIVFAKGSMLCLNEIKNIGSSVVGLDWTINMSTARNILGENQVIQGNLDPCALYQKENELLILADQLIKAAGHHHIFNLGHGVYPDTDFNKVKYLVDFIKEYRYPV